MSEYKTKKVSKLYEVTFIRQDNGEEQIHYVLCYDMQDIEDHYSDWTSIRPLLPLERL